MPPAATTVLQYGVGVYSRTILVPSLSLRALSLDLLALGPTSAGVWWLAILGETLCSTGSFEENTRGKLGATETTGEACEPRISTLAICATLPRCPTVYLWSSAAVAVSPQSLCRLYELWQLLGADLLGYTVSKCNVLFTRFEC